MDNEKRHEIANIINVYESSKMEAARKILHVLRDNCQSYGELKSEARNVIKSIRFDNRGSIVDRLEYLIANEMNDLPLTDRSKES